MNSIANVLKGKALGIPVWLWGLVLVGVGVLYLRQRQGQTTQQPSQGAPGQVPAYVSNFPGIPTGIDYNGVNYYPFGTLLPPGTGSPTTGGVASGSMPSCPIGSHAVQVPLGIASISGGAAPMGWMCVPDTPTPTPAVVNGSSGLTLQPSVPVVTIR